MVSMPLGNCYFTTMQTGFLHYLPSNNIYIYIFIGKIEEELALMLIPCC